MVDGQVTDDLERRRQQALALARARLRLKQQQEQAAAPGPEPAPEPTSEGLPWNEGAAQQIPEWARRNPELYGLAGAAREVLGPTVSGVGAAVGGVGGMAGGTLMGGPLGGALGTVGGAGAGYAAGEQLNYLADVALGNRPPRPGDENLLAALKDVGMGGALEVFGRGLTQLAPAAWNVLRRTLNAERGAANALLQAGGEALPAAIREGSQVATTPGTTATLAERAVASGREVPVAVATLERRLPATSTANVQSAFRVFEQRANAIQDQLARIDQTIQTQANQLAPQQMNQLRTVRDNLLNQLTQAQDELARAQSGLATRNLPQGQQQFGETLIERAQDIRQGVRQRTIQPLYAEAFAKAGDAPIDVSKVVSDAETILGRKLSDFAPESAPRTVRALAAVRPAPETTVIRQPGMPPISKTTQAEPTATLQQLDDIRKAINEDIAAAKQGAATSSIDSIALRQLSQLHRSIDDAVQGSASLSAEAKQAYDTAIRTYREEFVPRFRVGLPAKMLSQTKLGEPGILAGDVAEKFLNARQRGVDQILRLYGGDKTALQSLRGGVEDLFRTRVVDPVTLRVDPAKAQAFLARYDQQLTRLDAAGLNIRAGLDDVLKEAQQIDRGMRSLDRVAKNVKQDDAAAMITSWLSDKSRMGQGIGMLSADGRAALAEETRRRAMKFVRDGDGAGAVKFLEDNAETVKMALGKGKDYDKLLDTAKWAQQTQQVAKTAPEVTRREAVKLIESYSPDALKDLQLVIDDIQRMKTVGRLAAEGSVTPSPIAGKLGTEQLQEAGRLSAADSPMAFNMKYTVAKNMWQRLEGLVNRKTAAVLTRFMYEDPLAAAAAIEKEIARRGAPKAVRPPVAVGAGAAAASKLKGYESAQQPQE